MSPAAPEHHTVELYILRHAIAVSREDAGYPDDDRPLTDEGRKKMVNAAVGIGILVDRVDLIITSPLQRASSTTKIVSEVLGIGRDKIVVSDKLLPDAGARSIGDVIRAHHVATRIMIVGHEPGLSEFASSLLGSSRSAVEMRKGGLCRIDIESLRPPLRGRMIYHLTPKILRIIGKRGHEHRKTTTPAPSVSGKTHRRRGN